MSIKIVVADICKIGGRDYNQDYTAHSVDGDRACLVVCDGLGSYVGSEVASMLCASKINDSFVTDVLAEKDVFNSETAVAYAFAAHNFINDYKEKNPLIASSCTTAAFVLTGPKNTVMAHAGDSRIYLFRDGKLTYQSKDHSLAQLAVEMGSITTREIRTHKDQNKLTRVLGSDYFTEPDVSVFSEPLKPGDAFIICTDGFWEYVFEEEMEEALKAHKTPAEVIAALEKLLLGRVTKYNDNYTALVAMVTD